MYMCMRGVHSMSARESEIRQSRLTLNVEREYRITLLCIINRGSPFITHLRNISTALSHVYKLNLDF